MSKITLGTLKIISPKSVWEKEERDFTPWVAENIQEVSSVIGIPLVVEQTEKRVGAYELDIFARVDGTDKPVIIENQLEETDHKHLGQLLTYASGLDASIVIWIAPEVTDEHKAAINWLNQIAKDSVSFFLIRPEVVKIGDSLPAARFHLVTGPSEFSRTIRDVVDDEDAPRHSFRRSFWTGLIETMGHAGHSWASGRRPGKESWIGFPIGRSGIGVNVSMASGSRMRVEIYVYRDEGKEIFDLLYSKKAEIESKFPNEIISWERLDDAFASRVAVYRPYRKSDVESDTKERKELYLWIIPNILRFREIAIKYLRE
jgi:hypothetical protein